jgi:hypothetical protein
VQVVLGVVRRIVLDDQVDVVDVDAARGDVGGDQDPRIPGGECVQGPLALVLVAVPVDGGGADPGPAQLLGEPVGAMLGPHEEQRASLAAGDFRRDRHLVLCAEHQQAVLGQAGVHRLRDRVQRGVGDVRGHQLAHPAVQGGGEEHPLTAGRGGVQDPGDRGQEAEVGHVVGFVDHGDLDPAEPAGAAFHQVDEPARGGHHQVRVADAVDLAPDRDAAVDRRGVHAYAPAERREYVGDLLGQFPGRHQDQRAGRLLLPRRVGGRQPGEQRQAEGERLARPGLRPAENAASGQRVGQRPGLDRERFLDAGCG